MATRDLANARDHFRFGKEGSPRLGVTSAHVRHRRPRITWAAWRELRGQALAPGRGCTRIWYRAGTSQLANWGAPLMFAYLPDVLTYLAFGIVMAVCLWYVDGSLKNDAD